MAIETRIIKVRRGPAAQMDASKMLPGELAIATDQPILWFCWAPGQIAKVTSGSNEDQGNGGSYTLPQATANILGGVKAKAKTIETVEVAIDTATGRLYVPAGGGSITSEEIAKAVAAYIQANPITETDPTVNNKISTHNSSGAAHNDIRLLIQGLTNRLNTLADSDDTTLDQMSEIVAYIKSNKSLIEAITTGKVSTADIINNLTTNAANKPLSAAQGVLLRQMIEAGGGSGTGGNVYLPFITPEACGAVGDGVTDDTKAFETAIATGKKIICSGDKTYYFTQEIVSDLTKINIDGNQCTFKGFRLKINVNTAETNWVAAYPKPCSVIENIRFENPNGYTSCIKTGIPMKIAHCVVDHYDNWLKNYGDYMDYMVLENILTTWHIGTNYIIDLAHLGDKHVFREIDMGGYGSNRNFVRVSGCEAATFINCVLGGNHAIFESTVNFIGCHGEGESSINLEGDTNKSSVKFLGCYFWDMYGLPVGDTVSYDNCNFFVSYQSYRTVRETRAVAHDYLAFHTRNCRVVCAKESADPQSYILLDDLQKDVYDTAAYSSTKCISASSALAINGAKDWGLALGNYEYTFFPSSNPESIEYSDFANSKQTFTVSVNADTAIVGFTANMTYAGMYIWAYRKAPGGGVQRVIFPVRAERYYDYGEVFNGLKWKTVGSIPTPGNSKAVLRHGVYYTSDGNVNASNVLRIDTRTWTIVEGSGTGGGEEIPDTPDPPVTYKFEKGWVDSFGAEQPSNGSYPDATRSEYIPVIPETSYRITSSDGTSGDYMRIRKYNASKEYQGSSESWDTSKNPCTYNVGVGITFIRIVYLDDPDINRFVSIEKA